MQLRRQRSRAGPHRARLHHLLYHPPYRHHRRIAKPTRQARLDTRRQPFLHLLLLITLISRSRADRFPSLKWILAEPTSPGPSARRDFAMGYDWNRRFIYVFGGRTVGDVVLDDTWVYETDSRLWRPPRGGSGTKPAARFGMTFGMDQPLDNRRNQLVIFGGKNGQGQLMNDVWVLDTNNEVWREVTAIEGERPPGLVGAVGGMAQITVSGSDHFLKTQVVQRLVVSHGMMEGRRTSRDTFVLRLDGKFVVEDDLSGTWEKVLVSMEGARPGERENSVDFESERADEGDSERLAATSDGTFTAPSERFMASGTVLPNDKLLLYGGCGLGDLPCPGNDMWHLQPNGTILSSSGRWRPLRRCPQPSVSASVFPIAISTSEKPEYVGVFGGDGPSSMNPPEDGQISVMNVKTGTWATFIPASESGSLPSPRSGAGFVQTYTSSQTEQLSFDAYMFGGASAGGEAELMSDLWVLRSSPTLVAPQVDLGCVEALATDSRVGGAGGRTGPETGTGVQRTSGRLHGYLMTWGLLGILPLSIVVYALFCGQSRGVERGRRRCWWSLRGLFGALVVAVVALVVAGMVLVPGTPSSSSLPRLSLSINNPSSSHRSTLHSNLGTATLCFLALHFLLLLTYLICSCRRTRHSSPQADSAPPPPPIREDQATTALRTAMEEVHQQLKRFSNLMESRQHEDRHHQQQSQFPEYDGHLSPSGSADLVAKNVDATPKKPGGRRKRMRRSAPKIFFLLSCKYGVSCITIVLSAVTVALKLESLHPPTWSIVVVSIMLGFSFLALLYAFSRRLTSPGAMSASCPRDSALPIPNAQSSPRHSISGSTAANNTSSVILTTPFSGLMPSSQLSFSQTPTLDARDSSPTQYHSHLTQEDDRPVFQEDENDNDHNDPGDDEYDAPNVNNRDVIIMTIPKRKLAVVNA